jgi:SAM-dependent methyltransferase
MKYQNPMQYWLKGEFEEMYQDIDDPWGCAASSDSFDNEIFRLMVSQDFMNLTQKAKILDIGCGSGDSTHRLLSLILSSVDVVEMSGIDVSLTAISKANQRYPSINFQVKNILFDDIDSELNCICLSEVIWYILDDLRGVFGKLVNSLAAGGIVAIKQYFPNDQRIGREVVDGLFGFRNFLDSLKSDLNKVSDIVVDHGSSGKVLLVKLRKVYH